MVIKARTWVGNRTKLYSRWPDKELQVIQVDTVTKKAIAYDREFLTGRYKHEIVCDDAGNMHNQLVKKELSVEGCRLVFKFGPFKFKFWL